MSSIEFMRKYFCILLIIVLAKKSISQTVQDIIRIDEVKRIMGVLASDSLEGRGSFTRGCLKAAAFIAQEFENDSLLFFPGFDSYYQPVTILLKRENQLKDSLDRKKAELKLFNIVGVVEGKSKAAEVILITAHYDHISPADAGIDRIFNGANDNASGTTAMLMMAKYFAASKMNERTIVFCAFDGEEWGLLGSEQFTKLINPEAVKAVINIEMIGISDVGKNAFFITGENQSNISKIIRKNLKGTGVSLRSEAGMDLNLFARSDNYPFAKLGIPAHSFMSSYDRDPCYHATCDDLSRIEFEHLTQITRAIATSIESIVRGVDTPSRIRL